MFIHKNADGSLSYTGSFNKAQWEAALAEQDKGTEASPDASATPEQPKGNASRDEWVDHALATGASEGDVEGLSRNELREQFGKDGE